MYLSELNILNFKNYENAELSFDEKVNCLVGINGSGKTNLLDAIYYLAFTKSFFNPSDSQNILLNEAFFSIHGHFRNEGKVEKVSCALKKGHKKAVNRNGKVYERFADHVGLIPLVMISPIDILLIIEGSDVRRKWLDGLISQFDKRYLDHLIEYNKALYQRNALLKQMAKGSRDSGLLEVWDDKLVEHGEYLYQLRSMIMDDLVGYFDSYYKRIGMVSEDVGIEYQSHLQADESFTDQLKSAVDKDFRLLYTSVGPHKDDIDFAIDGRSVKKFASQGQQKTVLLALRLAQARMVHEKKELKPLMLLDDIYDKLDAERMARLLELLNTEDFGQLFITDTNKQHMMDLLNSAGMEGKFFEVKEGKVRSAENVEEKATT